MKLLDNPLVATVTGWLLLGFFTLALKPRTPEAYAALALRNPVWFFARFAAFWQFVGALGLDPAKAAEGFSKVISGRVKPITTGSVVAGTEDSDDAPPPPDPPAGGATPLIVGACFLLAACSSATPTPEQKHDAARATFAGQIADCIAEAKAHMPDQSDASKQRARGEYDVCRDGVVRTWSPADAGAEGGAR